MLLREKVLTAKNYRLYGMLLCSNLYPLAHSSPTSQEGGDVLDLDRSSELLLFHEAISNLVESEEQLIEEHKTIIEADQYLLEEETQLLQYVGEAEHDIEGKHSLYCQAGPCALVEGKHSLYCQAGPCALVMHGIM